MTCNPPILAAACKGLCRLGCRPSRPAARWLGIVLAVALFGVDSFQPVIGLVEVTQTSGKAKMADADAPQPASSAPQPLVVSIQAWHQPNGELWPAFVFQPTISAGSGGSAQSTQSIVSLGGGAALPVSNLTWNCPAPQVVRWLAAPSGQAPALRQAWCREICPIGPPIA